jgi:hypothetical protein
MKNEFDHGRKKLPLERHPVLPNQGRQFGTCRIRIVESGVGLRYRRMKTHSGEESQFPQKTNQNAASMETATC